MSDNAMKGRQIYPCGYKKKKELKDEIQKKNTIYC